MFVVLSRLVVVFGFAFFFFKLWCFFFLTFRVQVWFILGLSVVLRLSCELGFLMAGVKVIPMLRVIWGFMLALRMWLMLEVG